MTDHHHDDPRYQPGGLPMWQRVELTDPAHALDGAPRIVGRLLSAAHGHAVLGRLAVGDQSALAEAGVVSRRSYDTRRHEWGLGRDRVHGDCYLVAGGPNLIDWDSAALYGLEPLAHTHSEHSINRGEVTRDLAPTLAAALSEWLTQMSGVPIGFMPGDLWYLFPSNQDLGAAYLGPHQDAAVVYTPFRLGADGWLSAATGPTINVQYGPVLARLRDDAADLVRRSAVILNDEKSVRRVEADCLLYFWAPITVRAGDRPIISGVLQVDPLRGIDGRAPQFAWFRSQAANGLRSRAQVRILISNLLAGH